MLLGECALNLLLSVRAMDIGATASHLQKITLPQIELLHVHRADQFIALFLRITPQPPDIETVPHMFDAARDNDNPEKPFILAGRPVAALHGAMNAGGDLLGGIASLILWV
jgi:hypothetical protein